jgi:hypothetical protein
VAAEPKVALEDLLADEPDAVFELEPQAAKAMVLAAATAATL